MPEIIATIAFIIGIIFAAVNSEKIIKLINKKK